MPVRLAMAAFFAGASLRGALLGICLIHAMVCFVSYLRLRALHIIVFLNIKSNPWLGTTTVSQASAQLLFCAFFPLINDWYHDSYDVGYG
jgi:hypothetical protein